MTWGIALGAASATGVLPSVALEIVGRAAGFPIARFIFCGHAATAGAAGAAMLDR